MQDTALREKWFKKIEIINNSRLRLDEDERKFINGIAAWLKKDSENVISWKQSKWLGRICQRAMEVIA